MQLLPSLVESKRLLLRHWVADDAAALAAAVEASLEHLRPWMPWIAHEPVSLDGRRDLFRKWQQEWEQSVASMIQSKSSPINYARLCHEVSRNRS